jgi:hypothetical protein
MCARIDVPVSMMCRHLVVYIATPRLALATVLRLVRNEFPCDVTFSVLGTRLNETIDVSTSKDHTRALSFQNRRWCATVRTFDVIYWRKIISHGGVRANREGSRCQTVVGK